MLSPHTPSTSPALPSPHEASDPIHVIVAHEDHDAYLRALRMLANTFRGLPEAECVRPLPWRFDELGLESWRKRAVADAPRAEIIVISTSMTRVLPGHVELWLEACLAHERDRPMAVLALCPSFSCAESECRQRVREMTGRAGLDFIEAAGPILAAAQ